ncbi:hypothetical protein [Teichococcus aestuarii]|uniref:hypothetical protein n=1 Tax=Teichococcus aestuarii TaxID=568898 RepID=UPI003607B6B9
MERGAPFLLPAPTRVAAALVARWDILLGHAGTTATEIVLGLLLGTLLGMGTALLLAAGAARGAGCCRC